MSATHPQTDLDERYGDAGASPTPWPQARERLAAAELYWLSTVRPDGRPHVTPLLGVWQDGALHFTTGAEERKALNLAVNPQVVLTTGTNTWAEGYDLVVEGEAVRVTDDARLRGLARAWEEKYGAVWHFDVRDDGAFEAGGGPSFVYAVAPRTAFGFGKGDPFSQTRWRFA